MKKSTCLLFLLIINTLSAFSQVSVFDWVKSFSGSLSVNVNSIQLDNSHNLIIVGTYQGVVDFDPSAGVSSLTSIGVGSNLYITKLDSSGNFIWAKSFQVGFPYQNKIISIDDNDDLFLTGSFSGTVDFDPSNGVYNLTSTNNSSMYLLKLNSNGNFIWVKHIDGAAVGNSIALDQNSNIYLYGSFSGTVDFNPSLTGIFDLVSNNINFRPDLFLQKMDSNGNFVWVKSLPGLSQKYPVSISVDSQGEIIIIGNYSQGSIDLDPSANIDNFTALGSSNTTDVFISKYDNLGNYIWGKSVGGTDLDEVNALTLDANDNIIITGDFKGSGDFDPSPSPFNLSSIGITDAFVLKLNTSGNFIWAKSFGGGAEEFCGSVYSDYAGNILTTGYFSFTADFDPSANIINFTSFGQGDVFINNLDNNGNFNWAKRIGALSSQSGKSIIADQYGNIYTVGVFIGTVDFDPDSAESFLTANNDVYILKLKNNSITNLRNFSNKESATVFPNPTCDKLNINYLVTYETKVSIQLINSTGQIIEEVNQQQVLGNQTIVFDISELAKGMYVLKIADSFYTKEYKIFLN